MTDYPTISREKPKFPPYLDFQALRRLGIDYVQGLSSQLWTDYNLHDPGVTILEVLCYAVTDLGYRTQLDIKDLLTLNPANSPQKESNFFTPDEILTCNPVTIMDWRKRLVDIPGVRNAWLEKKLDYQPTVYADRPRGKLQYTLPDNQMEETALILKPKGLYRVCVDLDPQTSSTEIREAVKGVLCQYRNLCEDFDEILVLGEEEIALCGEIELELNADPEDVQVAIYVAVQEFLLPRLQFYSLQELLAQGKTLSDIFSGRPSALYDSKTAYKSHGFINPDDLKQLEVPEYLYTSDLYQIIMDIPGVRAIKKLTISNYINGVRQSEGDPWFLKLTDKYRPVLAVSQSKITFFKGDLPFNAKTDEVQQRYSQQQRAYIKALREPYELNLPIPRGRYLDIGDHYSVHHDFPLTYGIGDEGLSNTELPLRKAQAKQLKGYLIFFDQILANYLAQLANVRHLFSYDNSEEQPQKTYFSQTLNNVPGVDEIILNYYSCAGSDCPTGDLNERNDFIDYQQWLEAIREDPETYSDRRHRFLDHLLARFAESFTDYVLLNYRIDGGRRDDSQIIADKTRFLEDYPTLSRDRFRAFDYCLCDSETKPLDQKNNVSGFQKRVSRLLGMDFTQRSLNPYHVSLSPENTFKISILSLTKTAIYDDELTAQKGLNNFLSAALEPSHYRRLSYHPYYQYGWDVVDQENKPLVAYDRTFFSAKERNESRSRLLDNEALPLEYRIQEPNDQGGYSFTVTTATDETFSSIFDYENEEQAIEAAETAIEQIKKRNAYKKKILRLDSGNPQEFTQYGYALMDSMGTLLAESPDRFATVRERDQALQQWITGLQGNNNRVRVEPSRECFFFELLHTTGDSILLQGSQRFRSKQAAEQGFEALLSLAVRSDRYGRLNDLPSPKAYGFELLDDTDTVIARSLDTYNSEEEREAAIENIITSVAQSEFLSRILNPEGSFYPEIWEQGGHDLWIVRSSCAEEPSPDSDRREIETLAHQMENYLKIDTEIEDYPYSFLLKDETGTIIADYPCIYATEEEREEQIKYLRRNYVTRGNRLWIGKESFRDQGAATREGKRIRDLAAQRQRYEMTQFIGSHSRQIRAFLLFSVILLINSGLYQLSLIFFENYFYSYSFNLTDETGEVIANHPQRYSTQVQASRQIEQFWRQFRGLHTFVETPEIEPSQFIFELPAELFNLFEESQQGKLSQPILTSPKNERFSTESAAREAFLQRLSLIFQENNIVRHYDNPNCQFSFQLIDNKEPNKPIRAESFPSYQSRGQMERAIAFLQRIASGWSLNYTSPGTCCGYYFFVDLPNASDRPLTSLDNYPNEKQAWEAAGAFTEHLRYRRRYIQIDSNGLGITDEMGNLLAVSTVEGDLEQIFRSLNEMDASLLTIEAEEGEDISGYRFKLKDRAGNILLEGTQVQSDPETTESHFYRDVLSILLESGAIERISEAQGLSYQVVSLATETEETSLVLATHPQHYDSEMELEEAIQNLYLLIRTSRLTTDIQQQPPAYMGSIIEDEEGTVLLQATTTHETESEAWREGNTLLEMAGEVGIDPLEIGENFRLIEDEDSQDFYSWELVNEGKDRILGKPPYPFSTPEERKQAIARLQSCINNEGFHLIEHILLRPKHPPPSEDSPNPGDRLLPIPKTSETIPDAALCSANYDPYSFIISVVLPYWPNRFRDRNFRRFVEQTLRLEIPAHIALKICWINVYQMHTFENIYWQWIEQLHLETCENNTNNRTNILNSLIEILSNLNNIYPQGTLHDCQESDETDNPIILNQTALGTVNDSNDLMP